jgi:cellulose synthase/poly-beta-1,6-N-acetylglucosamine synthase-like glycosyltransferase
MLIEIIFWMSVGFVFYAYFGYLIILAGLSLFKNNQIKKGSVTPRVSFVITAYNEERQIKDKIDNTLMQKYPQDNFEVIVASDCSTDKTDEIVRSFNCKGVKLIRTAERKGKENAQKNAIATARGEILIFSDAATILQPDSVSNIVKNFNDPTVGCVSSIDRFMDKEGRISGEGAYVKYEMLLRDLETKVNTLVGLSGSFFAARREVCLNWSTDLQSDFNTVINSVKAGLRGVLDHETVGYYANIADEKKEFARKVRTVLRGISVFMKNLPMLNCFKYGLFSWQLFSHKLCRWLVPFALAGGLVSNAFLIGHSRTYLYLFICQCMFYAIAIVGIRTNFLTKLNTLKVPSFFVLVNLSILNAWYRYLRGDRVVSWDPSKR